MDALTWGGVSTAGHYAVVDMNETFADLEPVIQDGNGTWIVTAADNDFYNLVPSIYYNLDDLKAWLDANASAPVAFLPFDDNHTDGNHSGPGDYNGTNPNSAPAFQVDGNFSISENQSLVYDFNATDPDGDPLTYSILYGDDEHHFEIVASAGLLAFVSPRDFESPDDNNSDNIYEVTIEVSDGNASDILNIYVEIEDVLENEAPFFQNDGNLSVNENQIFVFDFNATDPNGDSLSYSILYGDDANALDLNESTGILSFLSPPDFENPDDNNTDNIYEATVQVSDGNATDILNLYLHVQDVFENTAPSDLNATNLIVNEERPAGTFVGQFIGIDDNPNAVLSYMLASGTGDTHNGLFSLQSNGVLRTAAVLDYEANASLNIRVRVRDEWNPAQILSLEKQFTVVVRDVNESIPNQSPVFSHSLQNHSIQENTVFVTELNASDPDGDFLSYSILLGGDANAFNVNISSGELSFVSPPDYENPNDSNLDNVYQLIVQATDGENNATMNLNVEVLDVSENAAPVFQNDGNFTVSENQSFIFDFNASDPDGDPLTYSILYGDDEHHFEVVPSSGLLAFVTPRDFENPDDNNSDNIYEATIQVSDGNATDQLNLYVHVLDVSENAAPIFYSDGNLSVNENQIFLSDFNATDPNGDSLSYSILYGDDANALDLNESTGILSFLSPPDFENPHDNNSDNIYEATIQVSDGNATDQLNLFVHVQNVIENVNPVIHSIGSIDVQHALDHEFWMSENSAIVLEINATDNDGDALSIHLTGGEDAGLFSVESLSDHNMSLDRIVFDGTPDFEDPIDADSNNTYTVYFRVVDGHGGFDEKRLTIRVIDVFENNGPESRIFHGL